MAAAEERNASGTGESMSLSPSPSPAFTFLLIHEDAAVRHELEDRLSSLQGGTVHLFHSGREAVVYLLGSGTKERESQAEKEVLRTVLFISPSISKLDALTTLRALQDSLKPLVDYVAVLADQPVPRIFMQCLSERLLIVPARPSVEDLRRLLSSFSSRPLPSSSPNSPRQSREKESKKEKSLSGDEPVTDKGGGDGIAESTAEEKPRGERREKEREKAFTSSPSLSPVVRLDQMELFASMMSKTVTFSWRSDLDRLGIGGDLAGLLGYQSVGERRQGQRGERDSHTSGLVPLSPAQNTDGTIMRTESRGDRSLTLEAWLSLVGPGDRESVRRTFHSFASLCSAEKDRDEEMGRTNGVTLQRKRKELLLYYQMQCRDGSWIDVRHTCQAGYFQEGEEEGETKESDKHRAPFLFGLVTHYSAGFTVVSPFSPPLPGGEMPGLEVAEEKGSVNSLSSRHLPSLPPPTAVTGRETETPETRGGEGYGTLSLKLHEMIVPRLESTLLLLSSPDGAILEIVANNMSPLPRFSLRTPLQSHAFWQGFRSTCEEAVREASRGISAKFTVPIDPAAKAAADSGVKEEAQQPPGVSSSSTFSQIESPSPHGVAQESPVSYITCVIKPLLHDQWDTVRVLLAEMKDVTDVALSGPSFSLQSTSYDVREHMRGGGDSEREEARGRDELMNSESGQSLLTSSFSSSYSSPSSFSSPSILGSHVLPRASARERERSTLPLLPPSSRSPVRLLGKRKIASKEPEGEGRKKVTEDKHPPSGASNEAPSSLPSERHQSLPGIICLEQLLSSVPPDVSLHFLSFLPAASLCALSQTCSRWRVMPDSLWASLLIKRWRPPASSLSQWSADIPTSPPRERSEERSNSSSSSSVWSGVRDEPDGEGRRDRGRGRPPVHTMVGGERVNGGAKRLLPVVRERRDKRWKLLSGLHDSLLPRAKLRYKMLASSEANWRKGKVSIKHLVEGSHTRAVLNVHLIERGEGEGEILLGERRGRERRGWTQRVLSAGLDGCVKLWDMSSGSLLRTLWPNGPVMDVEDGSQGLLSSLIIPGLQGEHRLLGQGVYLLTGNRQGILSVMNLWTGSSVDGRLPAWAGDRRRSNLWLGLEPTLSGDRVLAYSADGPAGPGDGQLVLEFQLSYGEEEEPFQQRAAGGGRGRMGSGRVLSSFSPRHPEREDQEREVTPSRLISTPPPSFSRGTGTATASSSSSSASSAASFASSSSSISSTSTNNGLGIRLARVYEVADEASSVSSAIYNPQGSLMAAVTSDGAVMLWDCNLGGRPGTSPTSVFFSGSSPLPSQGPLRTLRPPTPLVRHPLLLTEDEDAAAIPGGRRRHGHWAVHFQRSEPSCLLFSGGEDRIVRMWDLRSSSGEAMRLSHGHADGITSISSYGCAQLMTGDASGAIVHWDLRAGGTKLHRNRDHGGGAIRALDANGTSVVSGSDRGGVRVWSY